MARATKVKIFTLPLVMLFASPLNPRKHFDEAAIDELAESILAQGLLQNLVVRPVGERYEVVAGSRRLRALQKLAEQGRIEDSYAVKVDVRELTDDEALAVAITENAARADVHPMEQADAFLELSKMGFGIDEISVKMGVDRRVVGRMLQLAQGVSDTTRQLFLGGHINLSQASALTLVSKEEQEAYLEENTRRTYAEEDYEVRLPEGYVLDEDEEVLYNADGDEVDPDEEGVDLEPVLKEGAVPVSIRVNIGSGDSIRRQVQNAHIPLDRALFELSEYTGAGGTLTSDMFASEGFFNDRELFMKLQREAVARLTLQLGKEGHIVHNEDEMPTFEHFGPRENHITLYLDNTGRLHRKDDTSPKIIELRKLKDGKLPGVTVTGEPKKAPQNKKRMRLEDKALNRAAESALLGSWRHTLEFFILSILGVSGSRLKVDNPWSNPHDGYHEGATRSELEGFYTALELAGVKLDSAYGAKEGDPVRRCLGYVSSSSFPQVKSVLAGYSDDALQRLVQSFMAAMIAPIADGVLHEAHTHLLAEAKPDMHKFFTPDVEYLEACKNAELEAMFAAWGRGSLGMTKKGNVEYIPKQPEWRTYLPPRLADVSSAHVEPDIEDAPFDEEEELAAA